MLEGSEDHAAAAAAAAAEQREAAAVAALRSDAGVRIADYMLTFTEPGSGADLSLVPLLHAESGDGGDGDDGGGGSGGGSGGGGGNTEGGAGSGAGGAGGSGAVRAALAAEARLLRAAGALPPQPLGEESDVTADNVDLFAAKLMAFVGWHGVRLQARSLLAGLRDGVRPAHHLAALSPADLRDAACCAPAVEWGDDLAQLVRVNAPYSLQSAPVQYFLRALEDMGQADRAEFLRFATGCPTLPLGGLAALQPPLTIMRKGDLDSAHRSAAAVVDLELIEESEIAAASLATAAAAAAASVSAAAAGAAGAAGGAAAKKRPYAAAPAAPAAPPQQPSPFDTVPVSSSTCFHQIRLPPFSSLAVTKAQLNMSMKGSKGLIDLS